MRKLPERFVWEPDMPNECERCEKRRKLCKDCGKCRECCTCPDPCEVCGLYRASEAKPGEIICGCDYCSECGRKTHPDLWDYEYGCCEDCARKKSAQR